MTANYNVNGGVIVKDSTPNILFPMVQNDDHITGDTACTFSVTGERQYSIAGGAFTNHTETCTHRSDGMYDMKLSAAMTASEGLLVLRFFDADQNVDITMMTFMIQPIAVVGSAMTLAAGAVTATAIASNAITSAKVAAGAIHSTAIATDAINAAALKADACAKVTEYNWEALAADYTSPGSLGKYVGDIFTPVVSYLDYAISDVSSEVAAKAAPGDHMGLDANGILDVQAALNTQGLTPTRAAYLDAINTTVATNLNATVSSRAMPGDNMGLTTAGATAAWEDALAGHGVGTVGAALSDVLTDTASIQPTVATNLNTTVSSRAAPGDLMGLSTSAITSTKFAAGAISNAAIADDAISAAKIDTGAITAGTFAASAINNAAIATGAISNSKIAAGAIHSTALGSGAIHSTAIATDAITALTVKADAVTKIQTGLSTSAEIAALNDISTSEVATTLTNQGLTTARAGYLDLVNTNLDATISGVNTNIAALNDLSSTDVQGALTTQGYTAAKAAYLDVSIASRATQAQILADATPFNGANINATIASRAIPGDLMGLSTAAITAAKIDTGAITADKLATGAIAAGKIGAGAITATEAPTLDAAISTRATQAQILSDVTPFAGANINATISSRAAPGDDMGLTATGITAAWNEAVAGHGVGSVGAALSDVLADTAAIQPTIATNLDVVLSTRATPAQILSDVTPFAGANINATIASRAVPGDLMGLAALAITAAKIDTGAITADKLATGAIAAGKIGAGAITVTEAPTLDAAISTRATQAQILSDVTPFAGANINATIGSRAVPGDLMGLSTSAITSAKFATGAITGAAIADGAITSVKAPNLDVAISTRATQAQIISDATPFPGARIDAAITSRAEPGDDMGLTAAGATVAWNDALAGHGVGTVGAALSDVLTDTASIQPTVSTNLDTTISSRATQAQIISDATPFPGARINADITSRAAPGDLMGLSAAAITSAKFAAGAITGAAIADGAITSLKAPNLDAAVSTRATPAQILSDVTPFPGANINATVASRAAPGDLMGIVTSGITAAKIDIGAITADKLAAGAIAAGKIGIGAITSTEAPNLDAAVSTRATQAQILNDATPFPGARIDAAITTRATQAQIISDATPFPGARINADITSRAAPGDAMGITAGAIVTASFGAGAITATVAPNLDTNVGSRAQPGDGMGLTPAGKGDVQDAMTAQGMTVTRAGYIDHLDADITTRAAPGDDMGLTTDGKTDVQDAMTTQGLTVARTSKMDYLDVSVVSRAAAGDAMDLSPAGKLNVQDAVQTIGVEGALTLDDILKILLAVASGESTIDVGPPVVVTFKDPTGTINRVVATMDGSKRISVTLNPT